MKVLVLNCGSSSAKYKLFDMKGNNVTTRGIIDRIGMGLSKIQHETINREKLIIEQPIQDHRTAVEIIIQLLIHPKYGALQSVREINVVGHRVVHGGEYFRQPVLINDGVVDLLERCSEIAPLHNPPNVTGIKICLRLMPGIRQVAVFDTAFHQTMPDHAYMYATPYEYYEKYGLRKYGFHGTSHKYVSGRAAEILGRDAKELKIVTCHLGNGSSLCAVSGGESLDTTMGYTPTSGLVMGTRCGDLDPAIISFLAEKENMSHAEIFDLLNKKSGVLGISGLSSDFRDLEKACEDGHQRSRLALDLFVYSVVKGIGALSAAMGGLDILVFTAGIGENSPYIRQRVCSRLGFLGINIDLEKNDIRGFERDISSAQSSVKVLVVPTDEEMMIAKESFELYDVSEFNSLD